MKLLVTGGAGSLGANIVEHWLAKDVPVAVIDNFATSRKDALAPHDKLTLVEGSIAERATVDSLFAAFQPTHVAHCAAAYQDPDDWASDAATNTDGTVHVVKASREAGVKRFVYMQTALAYGEPRQDPVSPDHPLDPFTSYGISKAAGELFVRLSGVPWVSLRTAIVYGPRHTSGPIPTFAKRLSNGQGCFAVATTRDFLYLDDFLTLLEKTLEDGAATGPFNVASGTEVSIKQVHDMIADKLGITLEKEVEVREPGDDEVTSMRLDIEPTKAAFNWAPSINFNDGLDRQLAWYRDHGFGDSYSHLKMMQKN